MRRSAIGSHPISRLRGPKASAAEIGLSLGAEGRHPFGEVGQGESIAEQRQRPFVIVGLAIQDAADDRLGRSHAMLGIGGDGAGERVRFRQRIGGDLVYEPMASAVSASCSAPVKRMRLARAGPTRSTSNLVSNNE